LVEGSVWLRVENDGSEDVVGLMIERFGINWNISYALK
jgi:hypothetical protein